jgi:hypothetical protein
MYLLANSKREPLKSSPAPYQLTVFVSRLYHRCLNQSRNKLAPLRAANGG